VRVALRGGFLHNGFVRYLVTARVKPGRDETLERAIDEGTLGHGSVAEGEYLRNMSEARVDADGLVRWVEVCYCPTPLQEEREYWEEYFELINVQDAHARSRCRDVSGTEPWGCGSCDCTARLEARLAGRGEPFANALKNGCQGTKAEST
jgi:hypothetical protein